MTTTSVASKEGTRARQVRAAAEGLAYAAAPTFALMAWVAANDASPAMLCSLAPDILPIDGMTAMYLLMSLFHLQPWLKLACTDERAWSR